MQEVSISNLIEILKLIYIPGSPLFKETLIMMYKSIYMKFF